MLRILLRLVGRQKSNRPMTISNGFFTRFKYVSKSFSHTFCIRHRNRVKRLNGAI